MILIILLNCFSHYLLASFVSLLLVCLLGYLFVCNKVNLFSGFQTANLRLAKLLTIDVKLIYLCRCNTHCHI